MNAARSQTQKRNGPGQAGSLRILRNEPTLNSPTIRQYSSPANAGPNTIAPVPFYGGCRFCVLRCEVDGCLRAANLLTRTRLKSAK
ncbi:hypothetical protein RB3873 [Rhodopirellula baltica SH 1]|uniref:Uncharacterized protein n=1 Tax=Rhodopirellula baltica (strain DSM 10527 / NCIMB 13988 / SH1) TaxID=243090 RepID=Q7UTH8_RHOBA|nr:hypothetical protein RB3873 [Rhodopirellula baltica SH 1]